MKLMVRNNFSSIVGLIILVVALGLYNQTGTLRSTPLGNAPTTAITPHINLKTTTIDSTLLVNNQLSPRLGKAITTLVENDPQHYSFRANSADIQIVTTPNPSGLLLYQEVFVPVTNFSSTIDNISLAELVKLLTENINNNPFTQLVLVKDDIGVISQILLVQPTVATVDSYAKLAESLSPTSIGLIPFAELTPQLKVLQLNQTNILDKELNITDWPLVVSYFVVGQNSVDFSNQLLQILPPTNRDTNHLSSLVMTGVTAISRGVEYAIEQNHDPIFPARGVMDVLSRADITHIDSENPFFDTCLPEKEGIVLCGKTRSIAALTAIGTDVVDLTGNHQNDYGPANDLESINHLEAAGFLYFGGGKNESDANKTLYKKVNNTTLAFLGYNYFDSLNGPTYTSLAYMDRPGANYYDASKMTTAIDDSRNQADFVIVDFQFIETYSYTPLAEQVDVFHQTIDDGANLVVGVQSHQPQSIEFYKNGVILYGLGNFFFDQMWSEPTREGIIPRFTFNNGRLISIEILTTKLYDYAQPRFTNGPERTELLEKVLPSYVPTENQT